MTILLFLIAASGCAHKKQAFPFAISGNVSLKGAAGKDNAGVAVTITSIKLISATTYTDQDGNYAFGMLPEGLYALTVYKPGYIFSPGIRLAYAGLVGSSGQDFSMTSTWSRRYGGDGDDCIESIRPASDGGYVIAGYTDSTGGPSENFNALVARLDYQGNVRWSSVIRGDPDYWDMAFDAVETFENGTSGAPESMIVAAGYSQYDYGDDDAIIMKLNGIDGSEIWRGRYHEDGYDERANSLICADGGYYIAGWAESYAQYGNTDGLVLKYGPDGARAFAARYGGTGADSFSSIVRCPGGGFAAAGTRATATGGADFWLLFSDGMGIVSDNFYDSSDSGAMDEALSMAPAPDGGYFIAGHTNYSSIYESIRVIKTDSTGNAVWDAVARGSSSRRANSVAPTSDGGCVCAGYRDSFLTGDRDFYVVKFSRIGLVEWERSYDGGDGDDDEARAVLQTADGGYIVAGYATIEGKMDGWIIKLDQYGNMVNL